MRFGVLPIDTRIQAVDEIVIRRVFVRQAQAKATGIALLLRGAINGIAGGILAVVIGMISFVAEVCGTGDFVRVIWLPHHAA